MVPPLFRSTVSAVLLATVGAAFMLKYGARWTDGAAVLASAYAVGYAALFMALRRVDAGSFRWLQERRLFLVALFAVVLGAGIVVEVVPEASRVGRLPALEEWIRRGMAGLFPWGTATETNPSGLPFLFMLALPFYALGNLGFLEVAGVLLFGLVVLRHTRRHGDRWLQLGALLLLPPFYYELLVRSELFFNMALVPALFLLAERHLDVRRRDVRFVGLAVLFGLVLSTRAIVALPYAAYGAYRFRGHLRQGFLFLTLALLTFSGTLAPFIAWAPERFFTEGPFAVQGLYLHPSLAVFFALAAGMAGWRAKDRSDVLFATGTLLFFVVVVAAGPAVATWGLPAVLAEDRFDVAYFIFCVPFLILSLESRTSALSPEIDGRGLQATFDPPFSISDPRTTASHPNTNA